METTAQINEVGGSSPPGSTINEVYMFCVNCGSKTTVKDSRTDKDGVLRRRVCNKCHATMYTLEIEIDRSEFYERTQPIMNKYKKEY